MSKSNLDDILGTSADDKDETKVAETKKAEAKNDKSSTDESKATKSTAKKEVKSADDKKDDSKEDAELEEASKTVTEKTQESKAEDNQKSAETKNQDKTVSSSTDDKKAEDDKKPEPDDKVVTIQENEDKTETSIKSQSEFPYSLALNRPIVIYRGASLNLAGKSFGGTVRILGEDVDGFTPVEYVRSEIGLRKGYILTREVEEVWKSLK